MSQKVGDVVGEANCYKHGQTSTVIKSIEIKNGIKVVGSNCEECEL